MTEIWSCGGGTQSGAIAVLIAQGKLPKPDICFMTDTGREKSGTWPFVNGFIRPQLAKVGAELTIVQASDFANTDIFTTNEAGEESIMLPGYTNITGTVGKLSPFCSGTWKRDVGERWMRSIGIVTARCWIGISREEPQRLRAQHRPWLALFYPLTFEVPMWRTGCVELIRAQGWTGPIPHSACWLCPNQSDPEWIEMKLHQPEDFASACREEAKARLKDPHFYLHPSCVPLAEVDFFAQTTMFAERGCTGGCFT